MKKRKYILLGIILAVVLLVGATSCTPGDLKAFEGVLQKVDTLSGNVTVTLKDGTTATFNLKDINVDTIRKALGDVSLEPGDNVTGQRGRNGEVKDLKVSFADIQGTIKSLSTQNITGTANVTGSLTLTTTKGDITLQVTKKTMIMGWGTKKPVFTDLQVGQRVVVKYNVSTMEALAITVNADGKIQDNKGNPGNKGSQNNPGSKGNQGNQGNKGNQGHRA
jgi:hypothetical protein